MNDLHPDLARVIASEEDIRSHVRALADRIGHDYADVERLYIIAILKGSFIFLADLTRQLSIPHTVDFVALSTYGSGTTAGDVRMQLDTRVELKGKHVLLLDDIFDSGHTLTFLLDEFRRREPASLRLCVLVRKLRTGLPDIEIDYIGLDSPDVWLVGYGLDYAELHRTLPFIAELKSSVYQET